MNKALFAEILNRYSEPANYWECGEQQCIVHSRVFQGVLTEPPLPWGLSLLKQCECGKEDRIWGQPSWIQLLDTTFYIYFK